MCFEIIKACFFGDDGGLRTFGLKLPKKNKYNLFFEKFLIQSTLRRWILHQTILSYKAFALFLNHH